MGFLTKEAAGYQASARSKGIAVMSFSQIARQLGITRRSAEQAYWTGIRKLRSRAAHLAPIAAELENMRRQPATQTIYL
jgi:hypothetical protein